MDENSDKDMMMTDEGGVCVPGWDEMVREHPTRAATLRAMVNLELEEVKMTQAAILSEVIEDPILAGAGIELSTNSTQTIVRHIRSLMAAGHVSRAKIADDEPPLGKRKRRGRGGFRSPWRTAYVKRVLVSPNEHAKEGGNT